MFGIRRHNNDNLNGNEHSIMPHQKHKRSLDYTFAMEELVAASQELMKARSLEDILETVRIFGRQITGADGATFVLKDGDKCFYADESAIGPLWKGNRFPLSMCISGWVMTNKQAVAIEDIYKDDRIPHDAYRPTFVKSLMMVPVGRRDPVAAIGNYWGFHHKASDEELSVLQSLADMVSLAMDNICDHKKLHEMVSAVQKNNNVAADI